MADKHLLERPRPLKTIFYEGMLPTHPDRIDTRKSLEDINKVVTLVYASYGNTGEKYPKKLKEFVMAWADTYIPTGNTINENKFVPLFWAYYLFESHFSAEEKKKVQRWMTSIAEAQMARPYTPNNNWEVKRHKIIAAVGCINDDTRMKTYAIKGLKDYITSAYYADGTSNDLKERDALSYHNSGLKTAVAVFSSCTRFDSAFDLFSYTSDEGSSIENSVAYVLPYAKGTAQRKEWTNTKVALDKERAAAGLAEYQPGMLFDPKEALPLFEWACYYNTEWYTLFGEKDLTDNYTKTWVGLLNSPVIR